AQPLHKSGDPLALDRRRARAQETDGRPHRRLLRARRERPRGRAADERDERAALHSITSSARTRSVGGTAQPRTLPAFRLIVNSNLTGCSIGRSPGLAPLRILSMYAAARRKLSGTLGP